MEWFPRFQEGLQARQDDRDQGRKKANEAPLSPSRGSRSFKSVWLGLFCDDLWKTEFLDCFFVKPTGCLKRMIDLKSSYGVYRISPHNSINGSRMVTKI